MTIEALSTKLRERVLRAPRAGKPFNLLRWFSLLSLIAIAAVVGGTTIVMTRYVTRNLLLREAIVRRDVLENILTIEVGEAFFKRPDEKRDLSKLTVFINQVTSMPGFVSADLYGADSALVWSNDPKAVRRSIEPDARLAHAAKGYVSAQWGVDVAEDEQRLRASGVAVDPGRLVSMYLPIRGEKADEIFAIIKLLSTPHALFDSIADDVWFIQSTCIAVGALLYFAFLGIILRADRALRRQQERIREGEALATIGEMSAAVAHSIRNPLASIRSAAELAREDAAGDVAECLDDIIHEADRLSGWVSELLLAARGNVEFSEAVDVNDVIREALDGRALETTRRSIAVTFQKQTLPLIAGSRALLSHAILNIIANAEEAMGQNGDLLIESGLQPDGRIRVIIEDSGPGVPDRLLKQVFQPLFTTKPNGTGLGLALTKRIIERHAGEITIRSNPQRGARVELTLPVKA